MDYECWPLGDSALLLRFGAGIDVAVNAGVHRAAAALVAARLPGVATVAASYAALAMTLDLVSMERAGGVERLQQRIARVLESVGEDSREAPRCIEIPTRYGGADGPDLDELCERLDLNRTQLVDLHAGAEYRVAMVGFQPGFPYLLGLPERLHVPRRSSIRERVPAGSVAIAGAQAGIYPQESPGGWHLIGRTDVRLFDPDSRNPALLLPGDRVRFLPAR